MGFSDSVTYDEALTQYVGEFGRGQKIMVAVTSLYYIPNAIIFYLLVFLTLDPVTNRLWQCKDAADAACSAVWQSPSATDFCQLSPSQWEWTTLDNLATYFNMVCQQKWKVQLLNMMMFIGCLIGAALFGHLNDAWGRKKPLVCATVMCIVSVFLTAAAPRSGYWMMAIFRLLTGIGAAGQNQCVAILNTEIAGRSCRGRSAIISGMFWPTGEFVLVALAYCVHSWRSFTLITGAMSIAALTLSPWIPESARWLLSQGRLEEATAVVKQIAKWNGTRMPPMPLKAAQPETENVAATAPAVTAEAPKGVASLSAGTSLHDDDQDQTVADGICCVLNGQADPSNPSAGNNVLPVASGQLPAVVQRIGLSGALRQPKLLIRTVLLVFTWFSLYIVSYGVNLGAGSLPGSVYVTFTLLTVAEMTAQLMTVVIADKAGRHVILSFGLLLSGTACLACATTTRGAARAVLAVFGKYGSTVGMAVLGTFTTELFATPIRASAMGVFNEAGRLGSIIAPLMLMVGAQVNPHNAVFVPFLTFGLAALLAGLLTLALPETLGAPMAENIDDMNQLQSLFSAKPWQQGPVATVKFLLKAKAARAARRGQALSPEAPRQQKQTELQQQQQQDTGALDTTRSAETSTAHVCVDCPEQARQTETSSNSNGSHNAQTGHGMV